MKTNSSKNTFSPDSRAGGFAAIDDAIWGGGESALKQAGQWLEEQRIQAEIRRQWMLVHKVWLILEAHSWVKSFDVRWNDHRECASIGYEYDQQEVDEGALLAFLGGEGGGEAKEKLRARLRDEIRGNVCEPETVARFAFSDDMEACDWSPLDGSKLSDSFCLKKGSRDEIAKALLRAEALAGWEAMSLRHELAQARARQNSAPENEISSKTRVAGKRQAAKRV